MDTSIMTEEHEVMDERQHSTPENGEPQHISTNPEDLSFRYHSEISGSSKVSVIQSSGLPGSSAILLHQYAMHPDSSISTQSCDSLNMIHSTSERSNDERIGLRKNSSESNIPDHDEVGQKIHNDETPSNISWHTNARNDRCQSEETDNSLVTYRLADPQTQAQFSDTVYSDAHYELSVGTNQNPVYTSSLSVQNHQPHYSQVGDYHEMTAIASSYATDGNTGGMAVFTGLPSSANVENDSEDTNSSNSKIQDDGDMDMMNYPGHQLKKTANGLVNCGSNHRHVGAEMIDSNIEIDNRICNVVMVPTSDVITPSENITDLAYAKSIPHPEFSDRRNLMIVSPEAAHQDQMAHPTSIPSISTTVIHHYPDMSVIGMEDYGSSGNGQFQMNHISNEFCDDEDNQQKIFRNLMHQQASINPLLQSSRQFEESHLQMEPSDRLQHSTDNLIASVGDQHQAVSSYVSSSCHNSGQNSTPISHSSTLKLSNLPVQEKHDGYNTVGMQSLGCSSLDLSASANPSHTFLDQRSVDSSAHVEGFWCDECNIAYTDYCPEHQIQTISDKPVLSRAWASLPAAYLSINKLVDSYNENPVFGVFANKSIPKRTRFGPIEGILLKYDENYQFGRFKLLVEDESNAAMILDTSDEMNSNWMRFVRMADDFKETNLIVIQQNQQLYYSTTKAVNSKSELRVHYSPNYAKKWGLDFFPSLQQDVEKLWSCSQCEKKFVNAVELQAHTCLDIPIQSGNIHHEESQPSNGAEMVERNALEQQSNFCDSSNSGTENVLKNKPSVKEYKCKICDKTFSRSYTLKRHSKMHDTEKKYKCPMCDMSFNLIHNRNRHLKKHKLENDDHDITLKSLYTRNEDGGTEWLCTHCHLTFDNSSLLNLHTLTHAAENVGLNDGVSCTDSNSSQMSSSTQSGEKTSEETPLKCPECTKEFSSKKDLSMHASVHGKLITHKKCSSVGNSKSFRCKLCYKSFGDEERLRKHKLVHGRDDTKSLECQICSSRHLTVSALSCHLKTHSEKKVFECPMCKETFTHINKLKSHVRTHAIDGIYSCPSCDKKFKEYKHIRKHVFVFHSNKRFPCEQCGKLFTRFDKLKLHLLSHSEHKEFLCATCGKQFKRKDKLKDHMKRMHNGDQEKKKQAKATEAEASPKKFIPKVSPTDYHRFIYKCHDCLLGFKRRGMLVNHLAKRHPKITPESVPELNLPILKITRDYFCQHCNKVYKSSSKRKSHILRNHPGAEVPISNRIQGATADVAGSSNPSYSQPVGSVTTYPHNCDWCHKQYASRPKLVLHQRKKHPDMIQVSFDVKQPDKSSQNILQAVESPMVDESCTDLQPGEAQTSQVIQMENNDLVITTKKGKISLLKNTVPISKLQYVDRDNNVIANVQTTDVTVAPDLLTQAMSELTQRITEFRGGSGNDPEYLQLVMNATPNNTGVIGLKLMPSVQNEDGAQLQITNCLDNHVNQAANISQNVLNSNILSQFTRQSSPAQHSSTGQNSALNVKNANIIMPTSSLGRYTTGDGTMEAVLQSNNVTFELGNTATTLNMQEATCPEYSNR